LATGKRHTRLLNDAGAVHSLGREEFTSVTFLFKNNKYIMKILKRLKVFLITQKIHVKILKYLLKAKLLLVFFNL